MDNRTKRITFRITPKTEGKIDRFDSTELFEKLVIGPDETMEYLEKRKKSETGAKKVTLLTKGPGLSFRGMITPI